MFAISFSSKQKFAIFPVGVAVVIDGPCNPMRTIED